MGRVMIEAILTGLALGVAAGLCAAFVLAIAIGLFCAWRDR